MVAADHKQALAQQLLEHVERDAVVFQTSRAALYEAGEPLLKRAQDARAVRADTDFPELIQMVGGIAKIPTSAAGQIDHILDIALDGLRYRAPGA